jgi:glycosyltransferase involved in cell wall biosynthesis
MLEQAGLRRRALMIAYFFPPLGGGGVQRTLKHVKYLPDAGFEPIVVTTRLGWSPMRDAALARDVPPDTLVIRAPEIPLHVLKWGLHGALRRARLPTGITAYIGWPDEAAGWVPAATWNALRAVRRYRPDVLYSTSSPASAHLVALIVNHMTGVPWVADFRDAWMRNPQLERVAKPVDELSARLERAIVRRARCLIVADDSIQLLGMPSNDTRRTVISNGVDPDDVPSVGRPRRGQQMRISYVGTLYKERDAAPVFAALRELIDRGVVDPARVEVRIVGRATRNSDVNAERVPVTWTGYVDHRAAVAEMLAADVLLLYEPVIKRTPSAKIYEYLVSGRPILCVAGRDNLATRLVEELDAGACAEPGDPVAIEAAIERVYRRWEAGDLGVSPDVRTESLRRFSRAALARRLAAELDAAAAASSEPR